MLHSLKAWWLRRRLWAMLKFDLGLRYLVHRALHRYESMFYVAKAEMRSRFPSASLIEIADGHVTVVQDGITARVAA